MTISSKDYENIIDFGKYKQFADQAKEAEKRFPIIYALQSGNGDPLILFRFITDEKQPEAERYVDNIIPISAHFKNKKA